MAIIGTACGSVSDTATTTSSSVAAATAATTQEPTTTTSTPTNPASATTVVSATPAVPTVTSTTVSTTSTTAPATATTPSLAGGEGADGEGVGGADDEPRANTDSAASQPGDTTTVRSGGTTSDQPGDTASESAGLGDSLYPHLGNAGYDVEHYRIQLDIDPVANSITALTTISALATEELAEFNLDLSGLEVQRVAVDGTDAAFERSGSELTVQPERSVTAGEEFTVEVTYEGEPELINDPGWPLFGGLGWHNQEGVIYTLSEPSGAMTWYPSNNHPSDKATFEFHITVPASVTAAGTGLLVEETTANGRTTSIWQMNQPMATYLAAIYVGDFERIEGGRLDSDGPLLRDYVPPDAPLAVTHELAITPYVLRFLEGFLGPYPFDAYGTLVLPFDLQLAMENQTLSLHGSELLDITTIAHEAAHQWLGNSVTLEDWGDIWLNEGFATYLAYMFEATYYGNDLNEEMRKLANVLPIVGGEPPKAISVDQLFSPAVYLRGAMTLHALRLHAGDEAFFEILRNHYERSADGTTNTEEFLGIVEEFAGPEAVDLVESWLYDETLPDLP